MEVPHSKSKAKKKRKSSAQIPGQDFDDENNLNLAISKMNAASLAAYVNGRTQRYDPNLKDEISASRIKDTSSWEQLRTIDYIADFLDKQVSSAKDLCKASDQPGSPHTIVITAAGLRAADLTRALRKYQRNDAVVAKLFAKHVKLQETKELCKRKRMTIGVGTPQRIMDLITQEALSTIHLQRIVIDASHIDQKRRGLLEMKDTHLPMMRLLSLESIKDKELVFY